MRPIELARELPGDVYGTLVSGQNTTTSTGVLVGLFERDVVLLLGADTIPGDSGSPYLVQAGERVEAVGVNARAGAVGMLFTRSIIQNLLTALRAQ